MKNINAASAPLAAEVRRADPLPLEEFRRSLILQEKSDNTIGKYLHDVAYFLNYLDARYLTKEVVLEYKRRLMSCYKTSSVNSMLAALNCYLKFIGRTDCCVSACKRQQKIFMEESRELSCEEYERLVEMAERTGRSRLSHILQTIGSTGIRVSELKFITVEALAARAACINSKGKERVILLPQSLVELLTAYCRKMGISHGSIFITRTGRPVDRRNVWAEAKKLGVEAGISASKVFPHNLRHMFARCFYEREKDIVGLADYLGHSSIDTTRRYTMRGIAACLKRLEMGLVLTGKNRKITGQQKKKEKYAKKRSGRNRYRK